MPGSSKIQSVAADNSGSVFVAGVSDAITLDFGGAVLTTSVPTNGIALTRASFIAKYDAWGNVLWTRPAGTNSNDHPSPPLVMGTDASGNAYLAGRFQGTATFGSNTLVSAGPADMFVSKYDSEGQALWARRIG